MRTPVQTVHLPLLRSQALRESVVLMILVVPARVVGRRQQNDDSPIDESIFRLPASRGAVALLLPLPSFLRHDPSLYHAATPPRLVLLATLPILRSAGSILPRL